MSHSAIKQKKILILLLLMPFNWFLQEVMVNNIKIRVPSELRFAIYENYLQQLFASIANNEIFKKFHSNPFLNVLRKKEPKISRIGWPKPSAVSCIRAV